MRVNHFLAAAGDVGYRRWSVVDNVLRVHDIFAQQRAMYYYFCNQYFEWPQFLHLSQTHSSRPSISWLVLLSFEFLSRC